MHIRNTELSLTPRHRCLLWIAAGVLLRLIFLVWVRPSDDDTAVYLELGHNLLHHGIYGFNTDGVILPSLIRLPGYPLFLAFCESLFSWLSPDHWLTGVFALQAIADIGTGLLLAATARRHLSPRTGEAALALSMLCPFTAAYCGIAMTESLSVFAIALGFYAMERVLEARNLDRHDHAGLCLAGIAAALAMLLRPDGVLLLLSLGFALLLPLRSLRHNLRQRLSSALLFTCIALAPLLPWTARNWHTFHVFQPLAPRYVNDPGEYVNRGFYTWLSTWSTGFSDTANVYWGISELPISEDALPPAAFDSPEQRLRTLQLIHTLNQTGSINPALDAQFAALGAERIRNHPLHHYLLIPAARALDMLLRPRTEAFYLDLYWWHYDEHPAQSIAAVSLALLNLALILAALLAFIRRSVPWTLLPASYLILRLILLATMVNPEPRYTLECFPALILAASSLLSPGPSRARQTAGNPFRSLRIHLHTS